MSTAIALSSPSRASVNASKRNNQPVVKRLQQELMNLMMSKTSGITAFPEGENMMQWSATIQGVEDTPYANHTYKLSFQFSSNYPYSAPHVRFKSPIFHPNVDAQGNICLDILKENWSAVYNVRTVLLSIQNLLGDPNIDDPLNLEAANMYKDKAKFHTTVQQIYEQGKKQAK